jgi:hypothetical protein
MNVRTNPLRFFAAIALAVALTALRPATGAAQIFDICGDVDDDGSVSVTDGVQVLRSAAGLSSNCTKLICDVDVNGTIGVTDGVIVLRKAALLPISDNCIPLEGTPSRQLSHLIQRTEPMVTDVLNTFVEHRDEKVDQTLECINRADGTLDLTFLDGQLDASFSDCLLDNSLINGDAEDAGDDPIVAIDVTDQRSEETVTFEGSLRSSPLEDGYKYSGSLEAFPAFDQFETSDFFLVVNSLEVRGPDTFPSGTVTYEITPDTNLPDVQRIRMFFDRSNLARVQVEFSDGSVRNFQYDLEFRRF